jgi:hypothetical protein
MGNVLGINISSDTVYVRNKGTIIDIISSITIYSACNEDAIIQNSTGWTINTSVNSQNASKLDVTFVYDAGLLLVNDLQNIITIGLVEGISLNVDPANVLIHWKRTPTGNINICSNVETTVNLLYTFSNLIFNNNVIFTSNNYVVNFDKTCLQDYSPFITTISSTITEQGHDIVCIGSTTIGSGTWHITAEGGFNLKNKKYFFISDKAVSDFSTLAEYYDYIKSNDMILSSFGTHQIASTGNAYPVTTSMVYTNALEANVIYWCFTCESSTANNIIFEGDVISSNEYVDGASNTASLLAIRISF